MGGQDNYEYDVFILFAEEDAAWVNGYLIPALDNAGVKSKTPEHFRLGVPELDEFERSIEQSKRTLIVTSPAYQQDSLLDFVDTIAQKHGHETGTWPVIPLILKPTHLEPRLNALTKVDASNPDNWDSVVEKLCHELQAQIPSVRVEKPECPYPGLRAFNVTDSSHFFGRDQEVERLLNQVKQSTVCTVIGPSGCGKSSLVKAGLIPKVETSSLFGPTEWTFQIIRPSKTPLQTLNQAIDNRTALGDVTQVNHKQQRLLLVIDQLEEIFAADSEEQRAFFQRVKDFSTDPHCYVVMTLRADFYADLMESDLWSIVQYHKMEIAQLDEDGLREAIRKPAEQAGVYIESALVERLVADAEGGSSVLPFLQETMHLLWDRLERRYLSTNAYDSLVLPYKNLYGKGVSGLEIVMSSQADQTISEMSEDQRYIAKRIFLQMIHFGEGKRHTRRQEYLSEVKAAGDSDEDFESVIQQLSENRLITVDKNIDGQVVVDISHEALIRGWRTFDNWVAEGKDEEKFRRFLQLKVNAWLDFKKNKSTLLSRNEYLHTKKTIKKLKLSKETALNSFALDFLSESRREYLKSEFLKYLFPIALSAFLFLLVSFSLEVYFEIKIKENKDLAIKNSPLVKINIEEYLSKTKEDSHLNKYLSDWGDYEIEKYEVTNANYCLCVKSADFCRDSRDWKGYHTCNEEVKDLPATGIDMVDAYYYCKWIDRNLPHEFEWELAAIKSKPHLKNIIPGVNFNATSEKNETNFKENYKWPVYKSNLSNDNIKGLFDNVSEWTISPDLSISSDDYIFGFWPIETPLGQYIYRGGSFSTDINDAKGFLRKSAFHNDGLEEVGFRCVKRSKDIFDVLVKWDKSGRGLTGL